MLPMTLSIGNMATATAFFVNRPRWRTSLNMFRELQDCRLIAFTLQVFADLMQNPQTSFPFVQIDQRKGKGFSCLFIFYTRHYLNNNS